jgi:hypothetical protein
MKKLFLVIDQKGLAKAYPSFKEAKDKFDQMCAAHIKIMSDSPSFGYKRAKFDVDGSQVLQFRSWHRSIVNGKPRFFNEIFSLQSIVTE